MSKNHKTALVSGPGVSHACILRCISSTLSQLVGQSAAREENILQHQEVNVRTRSSNEGDKMKEQYLYRKNISILGNSFNFFQEESERKKTWEKQDFVFLHMPQVLLQVAKHIFLTPSLASRVFHFVVCPC